MIKQIKGSKKKTGAWGESLAAGYLESNGVKIIGRNVRTPYGEIDILGEVDAQILFVEVKTLKNRLFGDPEVAVSEVKQSHMTNSALHFLQENDLMDADWRIDVIAVNAAAGQQPEIKWFKNAING